MFQHEIDDIWDEAYQKGRADALTSNGINIYVDKIRADAIDEFVKLLNNTVMNNQKTIYDYKEVCGLVYRVSEQLLQTIK